MDAVFELLATKRVPSELLVMMMTEDNEETLSVDVPPSGADMDAMEAKVGQLPPAYREWIARFGATPTPN